SAFRRLADRAHRVARGDRVHACDVARERNAAAGIGALRVDLARGGVAVDHVVGRPAGEQLARRAEIAVETAAPHALVLDQIAENETRTLLLDRIAPGDRAHPVERCTRLCAPTGHFRASPAWDAIEQLGGDVVWREQTDGGLAQQ